MAALERQIGQLAVHLRTDDPQSGSSIPARSRFSELISIRRVLKSRTASDLKKKRCLRTTAVGEASPYQLTLD